MMTVWVEPSYFQSMFSTFSVLIESGSSGRNGAPSTVSQRDEPSSNSARPMAAKSVEGSGMAVIVMEEGSDVYGDRNLKVEGR